MLKSIHIQLLFYQVANATLSYSKSLLTTDRRHNMISCETLRDISIGSIIRTEAPKRRWNYASYKSHNGEKEQLLDVKSFGNEIDWFFVGIEIIAGKIYLKCIEKNPILSLNLRGGFGCFYGEKELNSISRYFFKETGIINVRSINADDVNRLLCVKIQTKNKWYTFKQGEYSPKSYSKHRHENKGRRVRNSAYFYEETELPQHFANGIIFIDKPYWLASRLVSVEQDVASFGIGKVTEKMVNMENILFNSTGASNTSKGYVRSMICIDPEKFSLEKIGENIFRLKKI